MILPKVGDVLKVERGIIVHGCNCQGVMNSGIAKQVREEFPEVYELYRSNYETNGLQLGRISFVYVKPEKVIVNATTQEFYGRPSGVVYVNYHALRNCFKLVNELAMVDKLPVHFPLIGADRGGGDWETIAGIIDEELDDSLEKFVWRLK